MGLCSAGRAGQPALHVVGLAVTRRVAIATALTLAIATHPANRVRAQDATAGGASAVTVVAAFNAARNAGDVDAAAALLAPGVLLGAFAWAAPPTGDDAGRWLRQQAGAGTRIEAWGYRSEGDTVTYAFRVSDRSSVAGGLPPLEGTAEAVVRGGRIASLVEAVDIESRQRRGAAVRALANTLSTRVAEQPEGVLGAREWAGPPIGAGLAAAAAALLGAIGLALRPRTH